MEAVVGVMRIVAADWIFPPGAPPIEQGALLMHGDTILDMGDLQTLRGAVECAKEVHLKKTALVPGLINCHTHLELSSLQKLPVRKGFTGWLRDLLEQKSRFTEEEVLESAEKAALEALAMGTAHVADVSSGLVTLLPLIRTGLPGTLFLEFLGLGPEAVAAFERDRPLFEEEDTEGIRILPACHAPFSTSKELFRLIGEWARQKGRPTTVHLAESKEEVELLSSGQGELSGFLKERGMESAWFPEPGAGPVAYLNQLNFLHEGLIAVHLVQAGAKDLALLKEKGVIPCLCPSSNLHLTGRLPPVDQMLKMGLKPCLGTDSPASGDSMNLFNELAILLDAGVAAAEVLEMATLNGANALNLPPHFGRIEPGIAPSLIQLTCEPAPGEDPLVCALRAGAQGWLSWLTRPRNGKEL
jgi:cytosine/adenosine deaminase-related metal-dependent hydrolase